MGAPMTIEPSMPEHVEEKNPDILDYALLAGAIWIFGGIHVSGKEYVPEIILTMPTPLVYKYQKDFKEFGGIVYKDNDGYFTLQIRKRKSVERILLGIQLFMKGEEAKQIKIALKMIEVLEVRKSKVSIEDKEEQTKILEELYAEWDNCRDSLKDWMHTLVEEGKREEISEGVPKAVWSKAYLLPKFMEEAGYPQVPKM
jgi:hypothetical protein